MGIYLWVNYLNNKSYVGKSVDLFNRLNKFIFLILIFLKIKKEKNAICWFNYVIHSSSEYQLCC
jgi:hypothetical protein